ncbi:MAG: sugar phosphate nucleotidyltransferase [candidate division WOR-3 bacterium]
MELYAIILAGGIGERFWPVSRRSFPKQFVPLFGRDSLIEQTRKRISRLCPLTQQRYIIPYEMTELLQMQTGIKRANIIYEPYGKNTAPAIGLAAIYIANSAPDATLIVLPADHYIEPVNNFIANIKVACKVAQHGYLVTFGIPPTRPETGYGYIQIGDVIERYGKITVHRAIEFKEKPTLDIALAYLQAKRFLWNSGMFVFRVSTILEAFRNFLPDFYAELINFQNYIGTRQERLMLERMYKQAPTTSIDYAVMEKAKNIAVVKANFLWDDVGSWLALERHFPAQRYGNVIIGEHYGVDTKESIVFSDSGVIATLGVENLVIVKAKDAVLVADKKRVGDLKALLRTIATTKSGKKFL